MTDKELLARIARSAGQKAGYKQLVRELSLGGGRERRFLLEQLARLTVRGSLVKLDREHWSIPKPLGVGGTRDNLAAGRLDLHRDGFGFVRPNAKQAVGDDDIFIPPNEINGAMQGDQVLVEVEPPKADGRRMGRIVRVLERRNPTVVGVFHYARSERAVGNTVVPFDERMTQTILIPEGKEIPPATEAQTPHRVLGSEAQSKIQYSDLEGLVVDVEITSWPTPTRPPIGKIIEVLGSPDDFGVDVEIMIRKHQLPRIFPENVLAEARAVAHLDLEEVESRQDFRSLPIVTIDGETARDFDDAVLVTERADGGYELQVHIADVAEYVRAATDLPGSPPPRNQRLFSGSRHSNVATGAFHQYMQPASRRGPPRPELHYAVGCDWSHRKLRDRRGRDSLGGAHDLYRGSCDSGRRRGDAGALWRVGIPPISQRARNGWGTQPCFHTQPCSRLRADAQIGRPDEPAARGTRQH
jgi:ribonuclease R